MYIKYFKFIFNYFTTMCCMVSYIRYIFALQITMHQKVEFLKMYYTVCNEFIFHASIHSENKNIYTENKNLKFKH